MKKLLIYFIMALLLVSCVTERITDENTDPGVDYIPIDEDDDRPANMYNLTGKLQKGPCPEGGEVLIQPLSSDNMYQTGGHYIGFTRDNFGRYYIPAEIEQDSSADVYAEAFFKGDCHNELTGGFDYQEFSSIIDVRDEENNINPLGHVRSYVARWLFGDPLITQVYGMSESGTEGNQDASFALAEIMIIDFLQMPAPGKKFTAMNLENADIGDAILELFNSMVLYNGIGDPGDYMTRFSIAVIENDLVFKSAIQETFNILPLLQITNNIKTRYLQLKLDVPPPPIWRLGAPPYYIPLMEEPQIIQGSFNLEDSSTCSSDMAYKKYAIPHILKTWFETSKYLASNFGEGKNVSIWSRGLHGDGYDAPGIELLTVSELRERLLDSTLGFHGELGAHGLSAGEEVYFMIESETPFILSVSCEGGFLPFGRKLFGNDGVDWLGSGDVTPWARKSGLKLSGVN